MLILQELQIPPWKSRVGFPSNNWYLQDFPPLQIEIEKKWREFSLVSSQNASLKHDRIIIISCHIRAIETRKTTTISIHPHLFPVNSHEFPIKSPWDPIYSPWQTPWYLHLWHLRQHRRYLYATRQWRERYHALGGSDTKAASQLEWRDGTAQYP